MRRTFSVYMSYAVGLEVEIDVPDMDDRSAVKKAIADKVNAVETPFANAELVSIDATDSETQESYSI